MPRFVILHHDHPFPHYDFMLEAGAALRTWRLLGEPVPDRPITAEALGEHRLAYLDYEGPVSGGRGRVVRWDAGTFVWVVNSADDVQVRLSGGRCHGPVRLLPTGSGWVWEWVSASD